MDDVRVDVRASIRAWMSEDPDESTRATLARLVEAADGGDDAARRELSSAFEGRLQFGTAGLRGALGPGPNRMNRVVVRQAAAGLAAYLREHGGHTVVIGFDARHQSDAFARESAAVFAGAGLRALVLPRALPTPVLAYAIRHLGCAAGVMVTASHNPPADNGYKVYLGDGSQIVPPADAAISAHIERIAAGPLEAIPLGASWETLGDDLLADYVATAASLAQPRGTRPPRIAYTPLHGVGGQVFAAVLEAAGFPEPVIVEQQWDPDPDFPTVAFPNPEEPGAMDLAFATAEQSAADLVIAHDPDADRCAVAIPQERKAAGISDWRRLSGDEVGSLLAWWITSRALPRPTLSAPPLSASEPESGSDARNSPESGPICASEPDSGSDAQGGNAQGGSAQGGNAQGGNAQGGNAQGQGVLAQSIVSGTMLAAIAQARGLDYAQTLTGFKWISRLPNLRFGYEEALGYCVDPEHVRDKDGITAGLLIVELASSLLEQGRTMQDILDDLDRAHGVHATDQVSIRLGSPGLIAQVMAHLRARPPTMVGGIPVERIDDLELGIDGLPPTDGLRIMLAHGGRVIVRPSGTEPKVKCYLQVIEPVDLAAGGTLEGARQSARSRLDALKADVRSWLAPQPG